MNGYMLDTTVFNHLVAWSICHIYEREMTRQQEFQMLVTTNIMVYTSTG
jgi:hypothetical protein